MLGSTFSVYLNLKKYHSLHFDFLWILLLLFYFSHCWYCLASPWQVGASNNQPLVTTSGLPRKVKEKMPSSCLGCVVIVAFRTHCWDSRENILFHDWWGFGDFITLISIFKLSYLVVIFVLLILLLGQYMLMFVEFLLWFFIAFQKKNWCKFHCGLVGKAFKTGIWSPSQLSDNRQAQAT